MKRALLSTALALWTVAIGAPAATTVTDAPERGKTSRSVAPIAGYNPTYGIFLGAGLFSTGPSLKWSAVGIFTFEGVFQIGIKFRPRWDGWSFELDPEYARGFEPYYGEGGKTRVQDRVRLLGDRARLGPTLRFHLSPNVGLLAFADWRGRRQWGVEDGASPYPAIPDEMTAVLGLGIEVDYRDDEESPSSGYYFEARVSHGPRTLTSLSPRRAFSQLEAGLKVFQELIPRTGIVAAVAIRGGTSFGEPGYLFRYRLGGGTLLRGYRENRFRGRKFYLQQNELRVPLLSFLETVAFVGFGDTAETEFLGPKLVYGGGLRIGLPPDWKSKARIDFGWGKDERGIFLDFGHAF